ncbi:MAG: glutathione-dependent formaldehyde-activating, GFA [Nitratireductor sp.]|nr:glutathione-dependent formaldehyde-activating, GFA [Nitratireductor sp.]
MSFLSGEDTTVAYVQGDKTLAMHHCPTCGCTTHWSPRDQGNRMAINARLMEPGAIAGLRIRHFDGAETFGFLD